MDSVQPHQIIYLEQKTREQETAQKTSRLYAEAIQVVPERQLCWARPLLLVEMRSADLSLTEAWTLGPAHVLVDSPDILWPLAYFKLALDTEVMPLLELLHNQPHGGKAQQSDRALSRERLHQFIQEFWQT